MADDPGEQDEFKQMKIAARREVADGIVLFELVAVDGAALPPFTAGAHVSVRAPNGLVRKYSLLNDPAETQRYQIAVKREAGGRGGSRSLCDDTSEGGVLAVGQPHNEFALVDKAPGFILVAGGIGITPILSMMHELEARGAKYKTYYACRTPALTAFRDELTSPPFKGKVTIHHDHGDPDKFLDLWPVFEKPNGWHVYCCGPTALMESVRDMTGHWSSALIHFEDFGGDRGKAKPDDKPFRIRAARSDRVVEVPAGMTALDCLRLAGIQVPASCESGTCGSCKTKLISGEPDHRDLVLAAHERAAFVMVCVSRALSDELVLDL